MATRLRGGGVVAAAVAAAAWALLAVGCEPQAWRRPDGTIVTGKIDFQREPTTNRVYHLYIPRVSWAFL